MQKRTFVSKKKLGGAGLYRQWDHWNEGDVMVFVLRGHTQNRKNKSKKDYTVDVVETFFKDKKEQARLNGKTMTLNSCGRFDSQMKQAKIGDTCQVTYTGQAEIKGGDYKGEMSHLMEVEIGEMSDGSTGSYDPNHADDEMDADEDYEDDEENDL